MSQDHTTDLAGPKQHPPTRRALLGCGVAALTLTGLGIAGQARAMGVSPFVLDLGGHGQGTSGVIAVKNDSQDVLPVEMRIQELGFDTDGVIQTGKDPGDLVVFPIQALIPPGQSRSFRVQYAGPPPTDGSKHYYITVAQLPVELKGEGSKVQVIYAFNVLVSVPVATAKPNIKVIDAVLGTDDTGKPEAVLTVENSAVTYGYFKDGRLKLTQKDDAGKVTFEQVLASGDLEKDIGLGLIGPGQKRRIPLKLKDLSATGTLTAEYKYSGG